MCVFIVSLKSKFRFNNVRYKKVFVSVSRNSPTKEMWALHNVENVFFMGVFSG